MRKITFAIVFFLLVSSGYSQRNGGFIQVPNSDIEIRGFNTSISNGCALRFRIQFNTLILRPYGSGSLGDEGFRYKIELFDTNGRKKTTQIVNPQNYSSRSSRGEYRYQIDLSNSGSGDVLFAKFTLEEQNNITIWTGGFPEDRVYFWRRGSADTRERTRCDEGSGNNNAVNLDITRLDVTNGNGVTSNALSNESITLIRNQNFSISGAIRNRGGRSSTATNAVFFVGSSSNSYPNGDAVEFRRTSINSIGSGSSRNFNVSQFITNSDILGGFQLSRGSSFYIFVVVDPNNTNNEPSDDRENNTEKFRFTYSGGTSGSPPDPDSNCIICPILDDGFSLQAKLPNGYSVDIYDLTGTKLLTKTISSEEEEKNILTDLPKQQIYILKSEKGTKKVFNQ